MQIPCNPHRGPCLSPHSTIAHCQDKEPPQKKLKVPQSVVSQAISESLLEGRHGSALTSFKAFCSANEHLKDIPAVGELQDTPVGPLFLTDKAVAMYLQAYWDSEKKMQVSSLSTHFQALKKAVRGLGHQPEPAWAKYKAPQPEHVSALFAKLQLELAYNPNTAPAKEEPYLDAAQVEAFCIQQVLLPMHFSTDIPPTEKVMAALWQRMQVAKSTRS